MGFFRKQQNAWPFCLHEKQLWTDPEQFIWHLAHSAIISFGFSGNSSEALEDFDCRKLLIEACFVSLLLIFVETFKKLT